MPIGKLVRVSPDTLEKLGKLARPFESPNDCINRLLSSRSCVPREPKTGEEQQPTETDPIEEADE